MVKKKRKVRKKIVWIQKKCVDRNSKRKIEVVLMIQKRVLFQFGILNYFNWINLSHGIIKS